MIRVFVARGAPAETFTVTLNTPEHDRFITGVDNPVRSSNGSFHLITHGSIEDRYGIDTAVRAMAILRREIPDAQLEIFGKGTALEPLKALAEDLGLNGSVRFRGFAPYAELAAALQTADVGLVTLRQDAATRWVHTTKMFEYISIDKPAIISRSTALEDYFDDKCIAFFDNNDPEELARIALSLYRQPERRATLARNATQVYDRIKWSVQAVEYCRLLEQLAARKA
ncbi:MAG: glycosyltransferase family 4 protein [Oscillochloris sp.]|nr:glycosyltransferase family 4 protein [Oscillochloris sp.]